MINLILLALQTVIEVGNLALQGSDGCIDVCQVGIALWRSDYIDSQMVAGRLRRCRLHAEDPGADGERGYGADDHGPLLPRRRHQRPVPFELVEHDYITCLANMMRTSVVSPGLTARLGKIVTASTWSLPNASSDSVMGSVPVLSSR